MSSSRNFIFEKIYDSEGGLEVLNIRCHYFSQFKLSGRNLNLFKFQSL